VSQRAAPRAIEEDQPSDGVGLKDELGEQLNASRRASISLS